MCFQGQANVDGVNDYVDDGVSDCVRWTSPPVFSTTMVDGTDKTEGTRTSCKKHIWRVRSPGWVTWSPER